jgi:predicted O-methyltransferase YrrM
VREYERTLYEKCAYSPVEKQLRRILPFAVDPLRPQWESIWFFVETAERIMTPSRSYMHPSFDDFDCEISYLLVRERRPAIVVEVSPAGGWSTSWILNAVKDNGSGTVFSYDLVDRARRILPRELTESRWVCLKGDVRRAGPLIPDSIDFLFVDCLHTGEFAHWYVEHLFPRLSKNATVVIDDVFIAADTLFTRKGGREGVESEPDVVLSWLAKQKLPYFTVAPSVAEDQFRILSSLRSELGIQGKIHYSEKNPALFFRSRAEVGR